MLAGAGRHTEVSLGSSCVFLSPPRSTQPVPLCPRQDHPRGSSYTLGALKNTEMCLYVDYKIPVVLYILACVLTCKAAR